MLVQITVEGSGRNKALRQIIKLGSTVRCYKQKDEYYISKWNTYYQIFKNKYYSNFNNLEEFKSIFLKRIEPEREIHVTMYLNEEIVGLLRIKYGEVDNWSFVQYCRETFAIKNKNLIISGLWSSTLSNSEEVTTKEIFCKYTKTKYKGITIYEKKRI